MTEHDERPRTGPLAPQERPARTGGRQAPVPKQKRPGPYRVPPREQRHGLLIVNTGDGKGKTTAALGVMLRAAGRGMRVGMLQFVKNMADHGEQRTARRLGVEILALGAGRAPGRDHETDDEALAIAGWAQCEAVIANGEYDVLILDELTLPMTCGWLDTPAVIAALAGRPKGTHVVVTGRHAPSALIDAADLVTDMRVIKHPLSAGEAPARPEPAPAVPPRDARHGLLIVNTGHGKGKSTAALGLLVRAAGDDMAVQMFQFIKSAETRYGEHVAARQLGIEIVPLGDGFTWLSSNIDEDRALAEQGWARVRAVVEDGQADVLILDELTYCLTYGWLNEEEVLATLRARPAWMHIVVTGRDATPALIALADIVTDMHLVRHPYREQGIGAQPGIEL